jgi:lipopolysaccharide export system ATP-binding protein
MSKRPIKKKYTAEDGGLEVKNLGKTYGSKAAVKDISFSVKPGEAIGLLGPNGAGKTTSFYMVMGLIKPDYGTINLRGNDITYLPMYKRARMGLGYLPQETSIFRGMNVEQNIMSILELIEPSAINRQNRLEELLSEFSVTHLRNVSAVALSGGERRRVEIARALASNPLFMLLDEPLAGIDPIAVAEVRNLIAKLKDRGIGVLITDHNVRETLGIVDRAYIIHDGQVLEEGKPEKIVSSKIVKQVYLGEQFSM